MYLYLPPLMGSASNLKVMRDILLGRVWQNAVAEVHHMSVNGERGGGSSHACQFMVIMASRRL